MRMTSTSIQSFIILQITPQANNSPDRGEDDRVDSQWKNPGNGTGNLEMFVAPIQAPVSVRLFQGPIIGPHRPK